MNIKVFDSTEALFNEASEKIIRLICDKPDSSIGLAAGNTPTLLYKKMVSAYEDEQVSFFNVKTFNLDEYVGLDKNHPNSFFCYTKQNLLDHIDIQQKNIFSLDGMARSHKDECLDYEKKIQAQGGLDICILGLGVNGHIAFNEPGSTKDSLTRAVDLSQSTMRNIEHLFVNEKIPTQGLTMGVQTILKSKYLMLLAFGESKTEAVRDMFLNKNPASYLLTHKNLFCFFDNVAAKQISNVIKT